MSTYAGGLLLPIQNSHVTIIFAFTCPGGETGRRTGLKIPGPERGVPVQFRPRAPFKTQILRSPQDFGSRLPLGFVSLTPANRLNLKSRAPKGACRFNSGPGHHLKPRSFAPLRI